MFQQNPVSSSAFKPISQYNPSANSDFFSSNNYIAKFAFLLLILFAFIVLLRVGILLISLFTKPDDSPKLIDGMVDAKQMIIFPQDPASNGAKTIYRSANQDTGIEFTWSVWIYIDNLQYNEGKYKHIFYKGNAGLNNQEEQSLGRNFPNNAPGLYLAPEKNTLVVMMNTYKEINEQVEVPDIPLNKWVNIIVRCKNTTLDVYINGTIARSIQLMGVPKQNYGDVYVASNGGFDGNISNLWYYNHALGTREIQKIAKDGPNTNSTGSMGTNIKASDYLSMRWFFYGAGDGFNPS
jgi:hypothetical protein